MAKKVKFNLVAAKNVVTVFWAFDGRCAKCKCELSFHGNGDNPIPHEFCLDHTIPQSWFSDRNERIDNSLTNLTALCRTCNSAKSDKMPNEFFTESELVDIRERQTRTIAWPKLIAYVRDNIAELNPASKFNRLFDKGSFYRPV